MRLPITARELSCGLGLMLLGGCAFDVTRVKQVPVQFSAINAAPEAFRLTHDVKISLGTGFPTRLKADTRWTQTGVTEHGRVFATTDQIVTVEASNIFEAQLIVSNRCITGFYLPVEGKFAPATRPVPISIQPNEPQQP